MGEEPSSCCTPTRRSADSPTSSKKSLASSPPSTRSSSRTSSASCASSSAFSVSALANYASPTLVHCLPSHSIPGSHLSLTATTDSSSKHEPSVAHSMRTSTLFTICTNHSIALASKLYLARIPILSTPGLS